MSQLARRVVIAAALVAALAPTALAGGPNARVEGPAKDGRYTVRTYECRISMLTSTPSRAPTTCSPQSTWTMRSTPTDLHVVAWAEGIVDGKRQTVPIKIGLTGQRGVYQFQRSWPKSGSWAIRMRLGNQALNAPATVTALERNGNVRANQLIWDGDGTKECVAILTGRDGC